MTKNHYFNGCESVKTSSLLVTGIKIVGIGTLIWTIHLYKNTSSKINSTLRKSFISKVQNELNVTDFFYDSFLMKIVWKGIWM